jgi:hypothetical protein
MMMWMVASVVFGGCMAFIVWRLYLAVVNIDKKLR